MQVNMRTAKIVESWSRVVAPHLLQAVEHDGNRLGGAANQLAQIGQRHLEFFEPQRNEFEEFT